MGSGGGGPMRVVLVQPSSFISDEITAAYRSHGRYKVHEAGGKIMQISLPPLGLLYLATPMVKAGHDVQILDAWSLQLTVGETVQEIIELKPDLVGLTMYFNSVRENYQISQQLKQFRNVTDGRRADAQSIVEAPAKVTAFRGAGNLAGDWKMKIETYDSHPIVSELGLSGPAPVVRAAARIASAFR